MEISVRPAIPRTGFSRSQIMILVLYGMSGLCALAYQIAWIRAISLVIGSTVYSFASVLAVYLSGIGVGSLLFRRVGANIPLPAFAVRAAWLSAGAGLSSIGGLFVIQQLPEIFLWGFRQGWLEHFSLYQLFGLALCSSVVLVPTVLLGSLFPVLVSWWTESSGDTGRGAGTIYAANTVGCILGVLVAGLFALPRLGVHGIIMTAAFVHGGTALGFMLVQAGRTSKAKAITAAVAMVMIYVGLAVAVPSWNRLVMTSGVYQYAPAMIKAENPDLHVYTADSRLLFYRDGADATVSVVESDYQRSLVVNGKYDASSRGDMPTQLMIGHLPMLMHPGAKRVLIIGLGSGVTAGAVAAYPGVEAIDIVEISPEVVEASHFFRPQNRAILEDPRVRLIVADARNYMLGCRETYDVIINQPSNPWMSGNASLFTYDYFQKLRKRLHPDGVLCQWFQLYHTGIGDVQSIGRGFAEIFPASSLWLSMSSDLLFVGSARSTSIDLARLEEVLARFPAIRDDLMLSGKGVPLSLAKMYFMGREALRAFCRDAELNTDDRPRVEFDAPRYMYRQTESETLSHMIEFAHKYPSTVPFTNVTYLRDSRLMAYGVPIRIKVPHESSRMDYSIDYVADRALVEVPGENRNLLLNGGQLTLAWNDGEFRQQLTATHLDLARTKEELSNYITSEEGYTPVMGGDIELPLGLDGLWQLSRKDENTNACIIHLAWSMQCPSGGVLEIVATRYIPDYYDEKIGEELSDFASIFEVEALQTR